MAQFFPHEKLDVYREAVGFASLAGELLCSWPSVWSVHDQLDRAVESIVMNLAKAARLRASEDGIYSLECSLGSVLECAACLDVALHRHLVDTPRVRFAKEALQRIARMEIGLRASWKGCVREKCEPYGGEATGYFLHETLAVYQRSLQIHGALESLWQEGRMRHRYVRRADELSTSITVNIAEGNGRFSKMDHDKFLCIAEEAGTKLAAYLDLIAGVSEREIGEAKSCLREVMAMLWGLHAYLKE